MGNHEVQVLVSSKCAHCRHLADVLGDLCLHEGVPVAVTDLARHPEVAERLGYEHSPLVLVDGRVADLADEGFPGIRHRLERP